MQEAQQGAPDDRCSVFEVKGKLRYYAEPWADNKQKVRIDLLLVRTTSGEDTSLMLPAQSGGRLQVQPQCVIRTDRTNTAQTLTDRFKDRNHWFEETGTLKQHEG